MQGIFPDSFKTSIIKPLLKNSDFDSNSLKLYRPLSNLSFISKVLETTVKCQLLDHFQEKKTLHPNQSAYRPGHSVEAALLDVYASRFSVLDSEKSAFLVLLDLSAAFDTIKSYFGIDGNFLSWIESY